MVTKIKIKGGTTPVFSITAHIDQGMDLDEFLTDRQVYAAFVHNDTRELRLIKELTSYDFTTDTFELQLTAEETLSLVDDGELKTKYILQIGVANGDESIVFAESTDDKIQVDVQTWELGKHINET